MEVIADGRKIKDLNKEIVSLKNKLRIPTSFFALYSLLEDARISKEKILSMDKIIKKRSKIPRFIYKK